jgi:hypothetical protein
MISKLLTFLSVGLLAVSCFNGGPGFFKQSGEQPATEDPYKYVDTTTEGGLATGTVFAGEEKTQVILAPEDSSVAGASAEFPPGSLAVDSQVSIGEGSAITDESLLQQLAISNNITDSGSSVLFASSQDIDSAQPMTLNIPLPAGSSLVDGDYPNLVVFYEIRKAGIGKKFKGVWIRKQLKIVGSFVKFTTKHFGTFQTAITQSLIDAPVEVDTEAVPTVAKRSIYYRPGVRVLMSEENEGQIQNGFQAWSAPLSPAKVKSTNTLTSWYRRALIQ